MGFDQWNMVEGTVYRILDIWVQALRNWQLPLPVSGTLTLGVLKCHERGVTSLAETWWRDVFWNLA